jgi:hypothetical protein
MRARGCRRRGPTAGLRCIDTTLSSALRAETRPHPVGELVPARFNDVLAATNDPDTFKGNAPIGTGLR